MPPPHGSWHGDINQAVEAVNDRLDAAAPRDIDYRIRREIEQPAGTDHVGLRKRTTLLLSVLDGTCVMTTGSSLK